MYVFVDPAKSAEPPINKFESSLNLFKTIPDESLVEIFSLALEDLSSSKDLEKSEFWILIMLSESSSYPEIFLLTKSSKY